jgi:peptidyl-prolyl cis-trans isomerase B (cyclophilin B)
VGNIKAILKTSRGEIVLNLFSSQVPMTVANFVNLAKQGFYDGINFHRVIANFMIQAGCPHGTGTGGPGYRFADEFHPDLTHHKAGILSMANAGPGTNGSQFFITHTKTPHLDNRHSVFGEVMDVASQAVVDSIQVGDKILGFSFENIADVDALLAQEEKHVSQWNKVLVSA